MCFLGYVQEIYPTIRSSRSNPRFLRFVLRTSVVLGAGFSVRIAEGSELTQERKMKEGRKSFPIYAVDAGDAL
jgi:hypothetical protein